MNNNAPIAEPAGPRWSPGWANWFSQVFQGLLGWNASFSAVVTADFGAVAANAEAQMPLQILARPGLQRPRVGDAVLVTPSQNKVGIIFTGVVTADNVVNITAKNFTTAPVAVSVVTLRVIIFQ